MVNARGTCTSLNLHVLGRKYLQWNRKKYFHTTCLFSVQSSHTCCPQVQTLECAHSTIMTLNWGFLAEIKNDPLSSMQGWTLLSSCYQVFFKHCQVEPIRGNKKQGCPETNFWDFKAWVRITHRYLKLHYHTFLRLAVIMYIQYFAIIVIVSLMRGKDKNYTSRI